MARGPDAPRINAGHSNLLKIKEFLGKNPALLIRAPPLAENPAQIDAVGAHGIPRLAHPTLIEPVRMLFKRCTHLRLHPVQTRDPESDLVLKSLDPGPH